MTEIHEPADVAPGPEARLLWPRLSAARAAELRLDVPTTDPAAVRSLGRLDDHGAAPVASGGRPVPPDRIARVQAEVRRLADEHGWPDGRDPVSLSAFDRAAAVALHREMAIVPADAAHDGVWHFLALVVLPDVVRWRRPEVEPSTVGGLLRHVLGRLWWWVHVFGPDLIEPDGRRPLTEGELRHLLGRPALVADHAVARAVAGAVLSVDLPRAEREVWAERLADRVLARAPIVCFEALTPDQLAAEVGAQLAAVVA